MDQASASPAASCACNPAAPRTSSSCSRSAGRSRTAALPPARSDPQCEPHAEPSNNRPRSSSPALCRLKAKRLSAAGILLRRDRKPGRFSEGLLLRRLHLAVIPVELVCRDYFRHLTVEKFLRKVLAGEISLPVIRMEGSQKAAKGVHITD